MSFRRTKSHHDHWIAFREAHRDHFNLTGLPETIWSRESKLKHFLEAGTVEGESADIQRLSNEQFCQLGRLVYHFYPDMQDYLDLLAFQKEEARRGWPGHPNANTTAT